MDLKTYEEFWVPTLVNDERRGYEGVAGLTNVVNKYVEGQALKTYEEFWIPTLAKDRRRYEEEYEEGQAIFWKRVRQPGSSNRSPSPSPKSNYMSTAEALFPQHPTLKDCI